MSKRRVSSPRRKATRRTSSNDPIKQHLQLYRFAGVSLGGGKTDRTSVAIIEYYPEHQRIFLRSLTEKIKVEAPLSADDKLVEMLTESDKPLTSIGFDAPMQMPKCMRCDLPCPGFARCQEPEIRWHWKMFAERAQNKRPAKIFTPYTERCSEVYLSQKLEESFHPHHALGANVAPLTARALFIARRLQAPTFEVYPPLTLWRVGRCLKVAKSHLRFFKHSVGGDESRLQFLKALVERDIAFLYQQDMRVMVESWHSFDAFLCALTGFLKFRGQVEKRPKDFPRSEAWVDFPKEQIEWFSKGG